MKKKTFNFLILFLFLLYVFLNFWGLNIKELQGDEASSLIAVIPAMKFYQDPKLLGSIFLFGHAPLRGLVEIPFLYIFGLREFWLYLPNVLASLGLFWINFLILKKWFDKHAVIIASIFLAVNGGIVLQRLVMGVGFFLLFTSLMIYYFYSFLEKQKMEKFSLSLLFLFLAIITYVEAVIFIPIILFWLKRRNLLREKKVLENLFTFFTFTFIFLTLWLIIPFLAFCLGLIPNLTDFGLFRIIKRAGGGINYNLSYCFDLLKRYNSLVLTILLIIGLGLSVFEKKSFFFWSFLLPPLLYFSLINTPTVHLFNYLNLIIIVSSVGWLKFLKLFKNKLAYSSKLFFYFILILAIFINLNFLKKRYYSQKTFSENGWGELIIRGLKSTAYLVRKNTHPCDKIYTDIEGHVARIYFGRGYVQDPKKAKMVILKKDLKQDKNYTKAFDREYSSFKKLMPYLKCKN